MDCLIHCRDTIHLWPTLNLSPDEALSHDYETADGRCEYGIESTFTVDTEEIQAKVVIIECDRIAGAVASSPPHDLASAEPEPSINSIVDSP